MARTLYEKQTWEDLPSEETPISADRLEHIEQGIYDNSDKMALKEVYGDNAISLGRKSGTDIGSNSLAAGAVVEASGDYSQAFGGQTKALGSYSHTEGYGTIAGNAYQHVEGVFNEENTSGYIHIVGGGQSNSKRKNIHTLDFLGNAMYAGTVESQGLILTDTETEQKYTLTIVNGNIEITAVE